MTDTHLDSDRGRGWYDHVLHMVGKVIFFLSEKILVVFHMHSMSEMFDQKCCMFIL